MKLLANRNKLSIFLIYTIISLMICIISISFMYDIERNAESGIIIVSWTGNLILLLYVYIYYKIHHKIFTLYNVLILFMYLFNWGQCLLWSFGIHVNGEIGSVNLFSNYPRPTSQQVLNGQLFTLLMMTVFLCGGLFVNTISSKKETRIRSGLLTERRILFKVSCVLAIIVVPLTFYRIVQAIMITFSYGYLALYYGEANIAGGILSQVEYLFFPILVGLLLGSNYSKRTRKTVYFIFFLYMLLYLMAGERGNWLYKLVLLIWFDHTYHKKIDFKKLVKYSIIATMVLYVVYAMVSLRNEALGSVSFTQILQAFSLENFPVISAISEMGGNMGIIIILLAEGSTIWTGYNTYIAAILGMPATFWLKYFGIDFQYLENWFSQDILKINWGSGFSFIGEAYINGGIYFSFVYILLLGIFIAYITKYRADEVDKNDVLSIAFKMTSCNAFMTMMRGSCHLSFKTWFLGTILFRGIVKVLSMITRSRR